MKVDGEKIRKYAAKATLLAMTMGLTPAEHYIALKMMFKASKQTIEELLEAGQK